MNEAAPSVAAFKNFAAKLVMVVAVVVMLVFYSKWAYAANEQDAEVQAQIDAAERAASRGPFNVADGAYQGTARGFGGDVTVEVAVENGYIQTIEIISAEHEDKAWLDMAVALLDTIPAEQSTDVDVVSDATYSSAGIINATKNALLAAPEAN